MADPQNDRSFLSSPYAAVYVLVLANVASYGLCFAQTGTIAIPGDILLRSGAMYSLAIARHEYWRLFAYGFLHADLLHLATNMFCLVLWGAQLERRVGAFNFILIYVCALVAGAVVSNASQSGPYFTVGASGAVSGILGALLALWILARIDVPANFFVLNIGLNVGIAAVASNIDWAAHAGGFLAGMIACALLDVIERTNALMLRCKFPEFVKFNILIVIGVAALLLWRGNPLSLAWSENIPFEFGYLVACWLAIKLIDLVLCIKKGLAIAALTFAAANAALVVFASSTFAPVFVADCAQSHVHAPRQIEAMRAAACANVNATLLFAAAGAFVLTALLFWPHIRRGIKDVGFVSASLQAERKRRRGI